MADAPKAAALRLPCATEVPLLAAAAAAAAAVAAADAAPRAWSLRRPGGGGGGGGGTDDRFWMRKEEDEEEERVAAEAAAEAAEASRPALRERLLPAASEQRGTLHERLPDRPGCEPRPGVVDGLRELPGTGVVAAEFPPLAAFEGGPNPGRMLMCYLAEEA